MKRERSPQNKQEGTPAKRRKGSRNSERNGEIEGKPLKVLTPKTSQELRTPCPQEEEYMKRTQDKKEGGYIQPPTYQTRSEVVGGLMMIPSSNRFLHRCMFLMFHMFNMLLMPVEQLVVGI